jgi:hypothetical protein
MHTVQREAYPDIGLQNARDVRYQPYEMMGWKARCSTASGLCFI